MKNSDLIIKLKSLKEVNPDEKFLKENRELLLNQISNSTTTRVGVFEKVLITSENLARLFSRPAFALGVFVLVLFGANFLSASVFEKSKPNDSLYIARLMSERLKVSTTFNQEAREKLEINYALRRAEDIATILSDEKFNVEENSDQVAKLSDDFIKEVEKVENSLSRIGVARIAKEASSNLSSESREGEEKIMTLADNSKDENGLEIYIPEEEGTEDLVGASIKTSSIVPSQISSEAETKSSSTTETNNEDIIIETASSLEKEEKASSSIKDLAEKKDFSGALNKLNEVVELMK